MARTVHTRREFCSVTEQLEVEGVFGTDTRYNNYVIREFPPLVTTSIYIVLDPREEDHVKRALAERRSFEDCMEFIDNLSASLHNSGRVPAFHVVDFAGIMPKKRRHNAAGL